MFTFQVIRLTSVVVYTKWFRSKCKAQAGGSAWPSYLRPHVLPVSPCPACIPMSHFLPFLPWCRQYPTGGRGHLGLFPRWPLSLLATSVSDRTLILPARRWWVGREPSTFTPPLRVNVAVAGGWKGSAETQASRQPFPEPGNVCAEPTDPWQQLLLSHASPWPQGAPTEEAVPADPGLCPIYLLLRKNGQGRRTEVWVHFWEHS